ncbi:MAG TPA: cytochrome c family protein [Terriglobales bacterium]|nr:cytochrome c family protein [Terriglobales bacterium]
MRRSLLPVGLLVLGLLASPPSVFSQYVGTTRCRGCHLPEAKSWEQTKMAKAFELLKPGVAAEKKKQKKLDPNKDYTRDAACLPCHVTGYGKPGGFVDIEKTPKLAGVTCETCHGAGQGYLKPGLMSLQNKEYKRTALIAAGLILPDENVCKACHNPKSPFYQPFDFALRKTQGVHAHVPLKYKHE